MGTRIRKIEGRTGAADADGASPLSLILSEWRRPAPVAPPPQVEQTPSPSRLWSQAAADADLARVHELAAQIRASLDPDRHAARLTVLGMYVTQAEAWHREKNWALGDVPDALERLTARWKEAG